MWRGLPACCWRAEVGRVRSPHGRQPGVTAGWPRPLWEAPAGSRARGLVARVAPLSVAAVAGG